MASGTKAKAGRKAGSVMAGAALAAVLGLLVVYVLPSQAPLTDPIAVAAQRFADPVAPLPAANPPAVATPAPSTPAVLPRFDLVRVEQDGSALVAGVAAPGSAVSVLIGPDVVATTAGDSSGSFVAMFDLAGSDQPRSVTLRMRLPDGAETVSQEQVILAPANVAPDASSAAPTAAASLATDADMVSLPAATTSSAAGATPAQMAQPAAAPSAPSQTGAAPSAILVGPSGVKVLQDGAGPQPISVDTIAYTAAGAVQLGGRARVGALVRVYLNDAFIAEMAVGGDGAWGGVLPETAAGIYTLRADEVDAAGKVTARFETPFQRETPASLAALLVAAPVLPAGPEGGVPPARAADETATVAAPAAPARPSQPASGTAQRAPTATRDAAAQPAPSATPAPPAQPMVPPANPALSVTVQPGFTLWAIARDQFGDGVLYVQVYEANKDRIRNPDLIYPGQVFALPSLPAAAAPRP